MKSNDALYQEMKQQKRREAEASRRQSEREIKLFLAYVEQERISPDERYFSLTKMRFIPLWTIYHWYGYDDQAAYVSSTGKLYEFRGLGWIAPASRHEKTYIGVTLAHMREQREKEATEQPVKKNRRALWRLSAR
jgi:hypothetical protein